MAQRKIDKVSYDNINKYIQKLRDNKIAVWRLYIFGSHAKGKARADSDIDLAIFWDQTEIDSFDADVQLMRLTRNVDLRIEPHSFSRKDFDSTGKILFPMVSPLFEAVMYVRMIQARKKSVDIYLNYTWADKNCKKKSVYY
ncbi:MAG: nucleotidyltransferase domain-containing protein [Desulfobacterales bacterium]|nr:nucleotidyltransferase domain-containing protein [Desulfobacterales bacterium]